MGIIGVVVVLIIFIIGLCDIKSFGKPYLLPAVPLDLNGLKNSIIKFPLKKIKKRPQYLSNNTYEQRSDEDET